jgi:ribosomal protein L11 methyltransferase
MKYIHVQFTCDPDSEIVKDVLAATLADVGFETFVQVPGGLDAYVPASLFSKQKVSELLAYLPVKADISWLHHELEDKNWNEEWERHYFQPIVIGDECCIHSSFHQPEKKYRYDIMIDPKMAFGTGHHQTTGLILKEILSLDMQYKTVLDMGCGTAVLAILASMRRATSVTAIDIDEWACNNAHENVQLNGVDNVRVLLGGAELLGDSTFDVILANINRNILLRDIPLYDKVLNRGGQIIMSGFYREDIPAIRTKGEEEGWTYLRFTEMDQWVAVTFMK